METQEKMKNEYHDVKVTITPDEKPRTSLHWLKRLVIYMITLLFLQWLIRYDKILRELGTRPDEWYWADWMCVKYGIYVGNSWFRFR